MPGWDWLWCAEIEPFPCAVLAARYPGSVNLSDMTADDFVERAVAVGLPEVVIAGTPCQAFSVAGQRQSLADDRGNLTLVFVRIVHALNAARLARGLGGLTVVWENVPGVLSTTDNAFGCFLGACVGHDDAVVSGLERSRWPDAGLVAGPLGRAAWRVLDAQYFGVPQRRRRVFAVVDLGERIDPCSVLFEPASLRGDTAPGKEAREGTAPTLAARTRGGGGLGTDFDCDGGLVAAVSSGHGWWDESDIGATLRADANPTKADTLIASTGDISHCLNAGGMGRQDYETETLIAHTLRGEGFDASEDGTGRGTPLVPVAFDARQSDVCIYGDRAAPLDTDGYSQAIAFSCKDHGTDAGDLAPTLRAMGHGDSHANGGGQIAVAFDTTQITSAANYSNPKPDDPCHPLAAGAHPPAIAFHPTQDPISNTDGTTHCLGTESKGGTATVEVTIDTLQLNRYYAPHANAHEADACEALRALRETVGTETFEEWGLGVLASLQPKEILRPILHGVGFRCPPFNGSGLVLIAQARSQNYPEGALHALWRAGCVGCPSPRWQPSEQLARELGAHLSLLPYSASPTSQFMYYLRSAAEGARLLRQALSEVEEAWRPAGGKTQPTQANHQVRRLTVEECEALQGFPRQFTDINYRNKPAADGNRYKALGNSMAVPVLRWLLSRIEALE